MFIGNVEIKGKVALAPMAGVADSAFRIICKEFGASYLISEMVSSKGMFFDDNKTKELLRVKECEHPIAYQIFGNEPYYMAKAAEKITMDYAPDIIDINMGCPAPKIAGNGNGSGLLLNPPLCGEIVAAVKSATDVPVTIKIRKGYARDNITGVEVAKVCEQSGCDAVTIHARTRDQMYAPSVDIDYIRRVKNAVSIPVIGNGDITDGKSAKNMMDVTGCDMVMVGRGALGKPWVFSEINAYLNGEIEPPHLTTEEKMAVMRRHIELAVELKGEYNAMKESRKHVSWYLHGFRGAAELRNRAGKLSSMDQLDEIINDVCTMENVKDQI